MLQVRLLGQFKVEIDGTPLDLASHPAQSLLAYLVLNAGRTQRREKLAGLFWPDSSEANARSNLRHALWRVRKALESGQTTEGDFIATDELTITFKADADYWLDVAVLEGKSDEVGPIDDLFEQISLYQGELLPGFYDEWMLLERERLQSIFEYKMQVLLDRLVAEQRWPDVLAWGERWIALGHIPEPAYRALMIAHSGLGDHSSMATVYQRCVEALQQELDVEPSAQTQALYERLLSGETPTARPLPDLPKLPDDPPYKGLQYFDEADADFFFGRELLTAKLVARLSASPPDEDEGGGRFLAVVGASGSGKSSLVRAGLIPALKCGEPLADGSLPPTGSKDWLIHVITPTAHPLEALATSLTHNSESVTATATLMDDLTRDSRILHLFIRRLLRKRQEAKRNKTEIKNLLLVVDQFEELFTLCRDEAERRAFIDNLLTAAGIGLVPSDEGPIDLTRDGPTLVAITLRADFYAHCAQYDHLRQALAQHQEYIGPMRPEELRRAVEGPAEQGGWRFEPGLVDLLLQDVGDEPGALPLLSHALLETWQRRRGDTMTFGGYNESGRVQGAIAQTAERVLQQLTPEQQAITRSIFLRLTELGEGTQDARRRARPAELIPQAEEKSAVEAVVKKLADARLITTSEDAVEVAHEVLIREWPTLRQWLNENREALYLHRHLTEAAQAWERLDRDSGELYRGARLAQVSEWAETHAYEMNALEREFLEASQALAHRRQAEREARRRRIIQGLALGLVITIVLLLLAGWQWSRAEQERQAALEAEARAEAQRDQAQINLSRQMSTLALSKIDEQLDLALLLSVEAARIADTMEARNALLTGLETNSQLTTYLRAHTEPIKSVAFSPDGQTMASASNDGTIILWDVATGQPLGLPLTGHTDTVRSVAFSPDTPEGTGGRTLASGSFDGTIILWDIANAGALETGQPLGPPLTDHTDAVWSVAFSPDGQTLASGSADHTIILWNIANAGALETGQPLGPPLIGHDSAVTSIAFSPDGQTLASGSMDNTVILWDVATRQPLGPALTGHTDAVRSVAFSPDGQILASGGDNTIILWSVATRQSLGSPLTGHTEAVWSVAFSPDGQTLASSSVDGTIILWDTSDSSSPGRSLGPPLTGHTDAVWSVAFSPDTPDTPEGTGGTGGQTMASASNDNTVILWHLNRPHPLGTRLTGHTDSVNSVAFSPDGQTLASGSFDSTIILWDTTTQQPLGSPLTDHTAAVRSVAFSPDSQTLASASGDKTIMLWDVANAKTVGSHPLGPPLTGHKGDVRSVAFSPDGQTLASGSADKTIILWDIANAAALDNARTLDDNASSLGQPLGLPLTGDAGVVDKVIFSPDGQILASHSSVDGTIILWDIANLDNARASGVGKPSLDQPLSLPLTGFPGSPGTVAFSPDGQTLASGTGYDNILVLWDMAGVRMVDGGQPSAPLTSSSEPMASLAYSPDGRTLALGGADNAIVLWNVTGDQPLGLPLTGHTGYVNSVAFSPNGRILASGGGDHTIMLWDTGFESWQARACRRANRNLSRAEWQQFFGDQPYRATCPDLPVPEE